MKSVVKRRKKAKHYKMVIRDVVDTLKEYIIFFLMLVILLVFYVMRGSWGGHLGLFLDVVFLPVVLVGNWGYEFRMSQANEFGRDRYKASWVALREDSSNPLYVKGCFRKNYKRNPNSKMAKLKGYYFCQIIAMIQMPVMIIRSIYIIVIFTKLENVGRYYSVIWPDLMIFSSLVISRILWLAFYIYYNGIINAERKKNQGAFFKEKAMCRKCLRNDNYGIFFYKRFSEYFKIFGETEVAFQERFHGTEYLLLGTGGNMGNNIKLDAMKYIGATDGFVRAPFVMEGMVLGIVGAAIPLVALYFLYNTAVEYVLTKFNVLTGVVAFIPVTDIYMTLLPIGLALGIGIGLIGSFLTTRKHLRV